MADCALQSGNYSDAIQLFDEISEDEMISDDFFKKAIAYEKNDLTQEAIKIMTTLLSKDPDFIQGYFYLQSLYENGEEERDTEAQHFYELAYPTLKSQSLFLSDYYFYLIEIGQKDKAKVLLNELLIIDPTNETWNEELSRLND